MIFVILPSSWRTSSLGSIDVSHQRRATMTIQSLWDDFKMSEWRLTGCFIMLLKNNLMAIESQRLHPYLRMCTTASIYWQQGKCIHSNTHTHTLIDNCYIWICLLFMSVLRLQELSGEHDPRIQPAPVEAAPAPAVEHYQAQPPPPSGTIDRLSLMHHSL